MSYCSITLQECLEKMELGERAVIHNGQIIAFITE